MAWSARHLHLSVLWLVIPERTLYVVYINAKWLYSYKTVACTMIGCAIVRNFLYVMLICPFMYWCLRAANIKWTPQVWHASWNSMKVNFVPVEILNGVEWVLGLSLFVHLRYLTWCAKMVWIYPKFNILPNIFCISIHRWSGIFVFHIYSVIIPKKFSF